MSFKEIYQSEVLQSRRDRSRRAYFWARVLGLVLLLTIGATLRSEPELRSALADAGMDAVIAMAVQQQAGPEFAIANHDAVMPRSTVKVNRLGSRPVATQTIDPQVMADELGRAMAAQQFSN